MKPQLMRSVVAALVLNSALIAQGKPDFTGTWEMDVTRNESLVQAVPIPPSTVIITTTPGAVRFETRTGTITAVETFPLEKVDNSQPAGTSGSDVELSWDGDTLVTMTREPVSGELTTKTRRLTLDSTGKIMTVETTLEIHHAYATNKSTDVFRRIE